MRAARATPLFTRQLACSTTYKTARQRFVEKQRVQQLQGRGMDSLRAQLDAARAAGDISIQQYLDMLREIRLMHWVAACIVCVSQRIEAEALYAYVCACVHVCETHGHGNFQNYFRK